jgi:hypothetical protein
MFGVVERRSMPHREAFDAAERRSVPHRETFDGMQRRSGPHRETFDAAERRSEPHREAFVGGERRSAPHREAFDAAERRSAPHRETFDAAERRSAPQREALDGVERRSAPHRGTFDAVERRSAALLLEPGMLALESMGTSAKQSPRFVVVLKLPRYQVPLLLVQARGIVGRMTGNSWFPSPLPSLAVVQQAIDDLSEAETRTLSRAPDAVAARNEKRRDLVALLQYLVAYVQAIATANPEHAASIAESAGMYLKKLGGRGPQVFAAEDGDHSGEVKVYFPKAGDRAAYEVQYSLDGGVTWIDHGTFNRASATIPSLKPGTTVHIRYRTIVKGVTSDWSDPIAIIVS